MKEMGGNPEALKTVVVNNRSVEEKMGRIHITET